MTASASAPERVLQRLDWQVVRRLDGLLQGDYRSLFRGQRRRLRRPARVPVRRRHPLHRLERHGADGRAVHPRVPRGPRDHRVVPARPEPVGRLRDRRIGAAQAERAGRLRDDAGAGADPPRQPGRRGLLRQPGRADDPGARRPGPGPAADQRPARTTRGRRARRSPTSAPLLEAGQRGDQGPLARVRDLGLHQRARAGSGRSTC